MPLFKIHMEAVKEFYVEAGSHDEALASAIAEDEARERGNGSVPWECDGWDAKPVAENQEQNVRRNPRLILKP